MSIVIVGGNERMVCQYQNICKNYGCKAKVFAKEKGAMKKKLGCPDLMILFTNTVSHKMVNRRTSRILYDKSRKRRNTDRKKCTFRSHEETGTFCPKNVDKRNRNHTCQCGKYGIL